MKFVNEMATKLAREMSRTCNYFRLKMRMQQFKTRNCDMHVTSDKTGCCGVNLVSKVGGGDLRRFGRGHQSGQGLRWRMPLIAKNRRRPAELL